MGSKSISVGADRFLALQWANFAYELFASSENRETSRKILREYLEGQMLGQVSTRKTTDQLVRLWLYPSDSYSALRDLTDSFSRMISKAQMPVLHLGMAVNVFPIYYETVRVIGTLERITDQISTKAISLRVVEKFPTTSSIPRTVDRVLQTLKDWGFIENADGSITVKQVLLQEPKLANWFILALLNATQQNEITVQELENCPLKLGINFSHPRSVVNESEDLFFSRNHQGLEVIRVKELATGLPSPHK